MHLMLLLLYCLLLLVLGLCHFIRRLQPVAHLHTMLVATMQLSALGVRPLLAETRQRHRYVHIGVCLCCTAIAALLCSYQALQLASCVMCAPQAPSAQPSYRDSPFSADVRRSVCLYLLIRSLTADQPSDCSPAGALTFMPAAGAHPKRLTLATSSGVKSGPHEGISVAAGTGPARETQPRSQGGDIG